MQINFVKIIPIIWGLIISCGCQEVLKFEIINIPPPLNEIAFVRYQLLGPSYDFEVWTMNEDGKNQTKLIKGKKFSRITEAVWSPDGKKIVFNVIYHPSKRIRDYSCEIWVAEIVKDKIEPKRILKRKTPVYNFSWSPDGKKIAFSISEIDSQGYTKSSNFYIIDATGKNLRKISGEGVSSCWSPDGKRIAFQSRENGIGRIIIMNVDGTNIERLTDNSSYVEERVPAWSPDDKWIAFVEIDFKKKKQQIVLLEPNTKGRYKLLSLPNPLFPISNICFSPDGKKIAIEVADLKNKHDEIYTIDIDSTSLKNLTNTPDWDESSPSWRPIAND